MKISKWSDLNGIESDEYRLFVSKDYVQIRKFMLLTSGIYLYFNFMSDDMILAILKLFGFDIEFEETPKLSKKEWHLVNFLSEDWWIARDMILYAFQSKPIKTNNGYFCGQLNDDYKRLANDLFPFVTFGRAWSVKELRGLEVAE